MAKHWLNYSEIPLKDFVNGIYLHLIKNILNIPLKARRIAAFMILRDWLGTYGEFKYLHQVFLGMHYRTGQHVPMNKGVEILKQNYSILETHFLAFMPDVKTYSERQLSVFHQITNKTY
ncbi:MAG: acyl carrier protein phosphodiesterase [Bacteroidales bacterium]|nr:acyl carrier protein phosphodiesterase [Bacteroidales bacterium]